MGKNLSVLFREGSFIWPFFSPSFCISDGRFVGQETTFHSAEFLFLLRLELLVREDLFSMRSKLQGNESSVLVISTDDECALFSRNA